MHYTPFIFTALAGIARAVHTSRKDHGVETEFMRLLSGIDGFVDWYMGGNDRYIPSRVFKADFWHFFVFMQIYCWTCVVITAALFPLPGWWPVLYITLPHIEGWFFTFFYHYVFPLKKAGNFWHFLRRVIDPFRNYHTEEQP